MRAPDLVSPSPLPAADPGATAMPPAGAVEEPRTEFRGALELLLEAQGLPPAGAEEAEGKPAEADVAGEEVLVLFALPAEKAGFVPESAQRAPEADPALGRGAIEIGRPEAEPPLASLEPGEAMAAAARDALRAPATGLASEPPVAAERSAVLPQPAGTADSPAAPVAPESDEVVARPAPVADPEVGSRAGAEARESRAAPARVVDGAPRADEAMTKGTDRRSAPTADPARPDASASRAAPEARSSDATRLQFERPRAEAPPTAEREMRDPRAVAPRPVRDAERAAIEPSPEAASPPPRATIFTAVPPSSAPVVAPAVSAPAAGTPAEAIPVHAEWLAARGGGTARLRLHPPELGEVELSVRVRGSSVQVSIHTEEAEAGRAALDGRELLVEALAARDLRVESLVVRSPDGVTTTATPGNSGDGSSEHLSGQSEGFSEREESRPQLRPPASQPEPQPDDHPVAPGGAVDLRI